MVVLGLFTLKYPAGNRRLFVLLTMFSLIVGIPTVATGWIPDIPLIMIGVYGGIMLVFLRRQKRKSQI
jgi:arginine exporter protein ArgO